MQALLHLSVQVSGSQSMFRPVGEAARSISTLGWIVFLVFLVVGLVMWFLIAWVGIRKRGSLEERPRVEPGGGQSWILVGGLLIPLAVLTTLFILNLDTLSGFPIHKDVDPPAAIRIIGHQWWWQVQYLMGPLQDHFETANELHIPVGQDIDIELAAADVIHSFWVPRLNGKEDLIPGQPNMIRIRADQPGAYRGQCAEFCGAQHAHMIIFVVAQPQAEFEDWLAHERAPASEPTDEDATRGKQIFLNGACALCHTVRGTGAAGGVAPDLTHVASRTGLASNMIPNDTADLEAWATHAQAIKPEVGMPNLTQFTGVQLRSLTAYLSQLK